jgi:DNA invertase Pin-like site-specific DNA recombinase
MSSERVTPAHLTRRAVIYVRQSTVDQVANNLESQRRQYALADRAVALGWQRATVEVIDDDLGVSGSGVARSGFDRLVAEVGLGRVGIVLAIEVSRLARNNRDWYHLLDLCALVDTLIGDADGLYHPGVFNDRLLLGLKGTMSEVELHLIRSRLAGGLWEAARRGALRTHLPIGFAYDRDGKIGLTPDEAIRETVALVFAKFNELGSARQVTTYFMEQGITVPHQDLRDGTISWRNAAFSPIHHMLTNPVYAGVYAYGRSKIEKRMDERGRLWKRQVPRPEAEWEVFIEDHHPGYITLATYHANRERLRANWRAPRYGGVGPVREGAALLQGLVRCGRCGRKMQVSYSGASGNVRRYSCHQAHRLHATEHACQSLGGVRLDERVAEIFLAALSPASLEATLAALEETEQRWQAERKQRELLVEQARFEADRARRQFDRVEPENRLVARTLERAWEQCLNELANTEADLARFVTDRPEAIGSDDRMWLERAGADLQAVWNAPTTSHRDRKQLLRCLVQEVVVTADRERAVADLTIIWVSGAVTHLTSRLNRVGQHRRVAPAKVLDLVRQLGPHYDNEQIAFILNARRLRTGQNNAFTARRVAPLRAQLGIRSPAPGDRTFEEGPEWKGVDQAAAELSVSPDTIRRWAREGFIEARQVMPAAPWRVRVTDDLKRRLVPDAPAGWVRLEEAATALGRSKQTILHWVQSGKLRSVQVVVGKRRGLRIELSERGNGLFADA